MSDMKKMFYYREDEVNRHCFFQPAPIENGSKVEVKEIENTLPDPSQRFRILTPRPAPQGLY